MSEDKPVKNTDVALHENVDCKIFMTARHALGINVGGSVIVLDPVEWHRMPQSIEAIIEAFEPFQIALDKNETDTIGRLSNDNHVLFVLSGSWTGSAEVTLGDLRKLASTIRSLQPKERL